MSRAPRKGTAAGLLGAMIAVSVAAATGNPGSRAAAPPQAVAAEAPAVTLGPLDEPSAVDIAPDGSILVAEAGASRVSIFDSHGRLRRLFGRHGDGSGELRGPRGLAVAPDGRVYVADSGHHRILVFSPAGVFERSWGRWGAARGGLHRPARLHAHH